MLVISQDNAKNHILKTETEKLIDIEYKFVNTSNENTYRGGSRKKFVPKTDLSQKSETLKRTPKLKITS